MNAERDHLGSQLYRVGVAGDPGHQEQDAVPAARGRRAGHEIAAQDRLSCGALDVHDRRLTADGNRFLDRADLQVCVDGGRAGSCQLDAVTFDGAAPCEGERDGIRAGTEIDDLVLAAVVGDHRPRLLDERGAGCLDRDARQHRA